MIKTLMERTRSVFGWEDAYFGGYERVVYDHPFISVPKSINYDIPKTKSLDYYTASKLCKLFLLKVNMFKVERLLATNCEVVTIEEFLVPVKVVVFSKSSVQQCVKYLIDNDTEMGNLFKHYASFLASVKFYFYMDEDNEKKKGGGDCPSPSMEEEKSVFGDDGEKTDGEEKVDSETLKKMMQAIGDIKAHQPYSSTTFNDAISGELKDKTTFNVQTRSRTPFHYEPSVEKDADALVNLLDISFNPKQDKVENLKFGKMSPHKIAEVPAGNMHVHYRVEDEVSTRPFSICILADESGSMIHNGCWVRQHHLVQVLYKAFSQILPQEKIFIYGHSGVEDPVVYVYNEKYNPVFDYVIHNQANKYRYKENYDGPVVENVYERVRKQTSDNIIFISISDGAPAGRGYGGMSAINDLKRVIEKCKRDGFVTVGVGLQFGMVKEIYSYYTIINDMKQLVKNVSSLVNRVVKTEFKD